MNIHSEKKQIKVLLTGASGTVGSEVLRQLGGRDDIQLTVFDLKTSKSEKVFKPYLSKARFAYGDISNEADVISVSKNKDVVIHLAAIIPPLADEKPDLAYRVNVEGTKNLILALQIYSPNAFLCTVPLFRYMATGWKIRISAWKTRSYQAWTMSMPKQNWNVND